MNSAEAMATLNWMLLTKNSWSKVSYIDFIIYHSTLRDVEAGIDSEEDDDAMLAALDAELGGVGLVKQEDNDSGDDGPDPAIHQAELEDLVKSNV